MWESLGLDRFWAFEVAHVAQVVLGVKPSLAPVAAAQAGHFLFLRRRGPSVGRVIPGQLRASLHNPGTEKRISHQNNRQYLQESAESSSSPAGEEGDDGEGGFMRVGEDVLDEQVRLAAVLQVEKTLEDISKTSQTIRESSHDTSVTC